MSKGINKLTEKEQLAKLVKDFMHIQYIENPSENFLIKAVKQNFRVLNGIENPSEKVQLAAVRNEPESIRYIENPTEKVCAHLIGNQKTVRFYYRKHEHRIPVIRLFAIDGTKLTKKLKLAYMKLNKPKFTREERKFFLDHITSVPYSNIRRCQYEGEFVIDKKKRKLIKSIQKKIEKTY